MMSSSEVPAAETPKEDGRTESVVEGEMEPSPPGETPKPATEQPSVEETAETSSSFATPQNINPRTAAIINQAEYVSTATNNSNKPNAPFHLLMLPASEQPKAQVLLEPMLLMDRKLRRDYLSRRYRAYHSRGSIGVNRVTTTDSIPSEPSTNTASAVASLPRTLSSNGCMDATLWSGASSLERALVDCCELPPQEEENGGTQLLVETPGGSLAKGFEVRFAGLVAKYCHTFGSRLLALAILERSLEQDQKDTLEEDDTDDDDNNNRSSDSESTDEGGDSDPAESEEEEESEEDEDDDEYDPNEKSPSKRRSRRVKSNKRGRPPKRAKKTPKEDEETKSQLPSKKPTTSKAEPAVETTTDDDAASGDDEDSQIDRMTAFFSAGGLKILRSWLMDAMAPVLAPTPKPVSGSSSQDAEAKSSLPKIYTPSQYGPMLLPLLILLSEIPFEMTLIVESKINKQIRRLSKQVDGLIEALKKQNKGKDAQALIIETFVDPAAGAGGCVVIRVQEVLNKLKETWEDHAKKIPVEATTSSTFVDPYESIKNKLKTKLTLLKAFEAGKIEKPDWLRKCEEVHREREKKRPRRAYNNNTTPVKKANTQQLALKEREAERAALKDRLKAAQEERKAHLQRLKTLNNKRIIPASQQVGGKEVPVVKRKRNGKSVKWKDGLSTDKVRKRDILEEVFMLEEEVADASPSGSNDQSAEESRDEPKGPDISLMKSSTDEYGLFEMFDCDETLLL